MGLEESFRAYALPKKILNKLNEYAYEKDSTSIYDVRFAASGMQSIVSYASKHCY